MSRRWYRLVLTYPNGRRVVIFELPSDVIDSKYDEFRDSAERGQVVWSFVRIETEDGYLVEEFRAPRVRS